MEKVRSGNRQFVKLDILHDENLKNISKTNLNYSEEVSEKILWLPSSTNLTDNQIEKICTTINIFFNRN